jgi:predicted ester cyclase
MIINTCFLSSSNLMSKSSSLKSRAAEPSSSLFPVVEKNKALVRQLIDFFNQHNLEEMEELMSSKYRLYLPSMQPLDWNGLKQLLSSVYYAAFPDLRAEFEDMTAGGNMVSARIRCVGTQKGEFLGISPTGKKVSFAGFLIQNFDIDNGKLAEGWLALDPDELQWKLRRINHVIHHKEIPSHP